MTLRNVLNVSLPSLVVTELRLVLKTVIRDRNLSFGLGILFH